MKLSAVSTLAEIDIIIFSDILHKSVYVNDDYE